MKAIIFTAVTLLVSISNAANYDCEGILGLSKYDPNAKKAKIENFQVTNLSATAGNVTIENISFSVYQKSSAGELILTIGEVQPNNQVTPYLSLAYAETVEPTQGKSVSVNLGRVAYLVCTGK